ncbi:hypothetical protein BO94DRAFT_450244, partial [Aspergillus sclerotioniger CBS 115572]
SIADQPQYSPPSLISHPLPQLPKFPKLYIYDGDNATALAIRQFIHERGGVRIRSGLLDVQPKDQVLPLLVHEHDYAGEVPILYLDHPARRPVEKVFGFGPITEYVDSVAVGGRKLYGDTAQDMAVVRSLIYCLNRDVVEPLYGWNNNRPGNGSGEEVTGLVPVPSRQEVLKRRVLESLEKMELDFLEQGKGGYLLGRSSAADVFFFSLVVAHGDRWDWFFDDDPRPRITQYFDRVRQRPMTGFAYEFWDTEAANVV